MIIHELALRSGIGGVGLGVRSALPSCRTVCHVEGEAFFAAILAARMESGELDPAPIWSYLPSFDGRPWSSLVDLVSGTVEEGDVAHVARIIDAVDPDVCFFCSESRERLFVLCDELVGRGYQCVQNAYAAADIGCPVDQSRSFVLARARHVTMEGSGRFFVPRTEEQRSSRGECLGFPPSPSDPEAFAQWADAGGAKPCVLRGADGVSSRLDRLHALQSDVIPALAAYAYEHLWRSLTASDELALQLANRREIVVH